MITKDKIINFIIACEAYKYERLTLSELIKNGGGKHDFKNNFSRQRRKYVFLH
jgi:hypothetical protein